MVKQVVWNIPFRGLMTLFTVAAALSTSGLALAAPAERKSPLPPAQNDMQQAIPPTLPGRPEQAVAHDPPTGGLRLQGAFGSDAFVAPDLGTVGNASIAATTSITPGYYQTSEYMAGSVAVGIVLVQSDGGTSPSGGSTDPSTESWTPEEKQLVVNKIKAALNWWAKMEPRAHLSFVSDDAVVPNAASNPLPTSVEPISRPRSDERYWVADAMSALGYAAPSYFTRVRDYDNDLRARYHTDWAFTIFVVDSSNDSDGYFSDGYFAYAYLGGPFMVMTYKNGSYGPENMDAVAAHEIGHIFNALDQYSNASQPCLSRSGYLAVENQNSQYDGCASNVSSIMRGQVAPYTANAIDAYAAGQIGWRDSDGDNILDPLDTELPISITAVLTDGNFVPFVSYNRAIISGTAWIMPHPSPSHPSVTINTLTGVQYRVDQGDWQPAIADDPKGALGSGAFDGITESYHLTISLTPGLRTVEVAALDSAGNTSSVYARQTITVLDPVDGGLITELDQPSGHVSAGQPVTIKGVAYDLSGSAIANVQFRVRINPDGGAWQSAVAQDGTFDSDREPFAVTINSLDTGTYTVEAFATNAEGKAEVNVACQVFTVTPRVFSVFLPTVMK